MASSIAARAGRNFLLKYGTGSPLTYATVTGLRTVELKINNGAVDITNKASGGWQEMLPGGGVESMDVTGSGVFDATGTQFKALQAASITPALVPLQLIDSPSGDTFTGLWSVEFTRGGPYNEAQTFSITLKSHGVIVFVAGS